MKGNVPEKFTTSTIIDYVANSTELNKKDVKAVLDSYFEVVQAGLNKGQRIPIGALGKLYVHEKPASPERQGVNPATGQPMTIKAKPASKVPKFRFNKSFKETVN